MSSKFLSESEVDQAIKVND